MDASSLVPPPARPKKRTGTSKYDFIKVKVWLGEDLDHYYILSRFLICRMLTVTKIPYIKAVKIALETKKYLVDNNLHDVTQAQLEDVLFGIVRAKGFDEAHIDCYRMVTQFYQSRQPLCIIICGAAWTGKSTLAQQLAARINIPNVMQTDVIYELLRSGPDSPLHPVPLWGRPGLAGGRCCDAALVREFRREARVVREGMEGDLIKTLSDGKPIIIEGLHLDPGLYIPDFGSRGLIMLPSRPTAALSAAAVAVAAGGGLHAAAAAGRSPGSSPLAGRGRYGRSLTMPQRTTAAPAADAAGVSAGAGSVGAPAAGLTEADQRQSQSDQEGKQLPVQQRQQQQQGVVLRPRSASAAEVSISVGGPLSPGSLVPPDAAVSAEAALGLLRNGSAATASQQQPWQSGHGQESSQQQLHQQQDRQVQQQQPQRLLRVSEESSQAEQQLPSLPPLPPLRVRRQKQQQDATTVDMYGNALGNSSSSSTVPHCLTPLGVSSTITSSVKQSVQCKELMGTPFADAAAAGAAAGNPSGTTSPAAAVAAAHAADARPMDRLFRGPDDLPVVMTGEEVQVCAAAAEAAALQQHRQEQQAHQQLQQQLQQQGRPQPGSPFSSASDVSSLGVGGGSPPCISQEHSTTEVVSRVCSCASLGSPAVLLSQEPSGAEMWSPISATGGAAAAAAAAAPDGAGCGAFMCRQLSSGVRGSSFRVRGSPGVGSRYLEQLPEEGTEQQQQGNTVVASQQVLQQQQHQQQQQQPQPQPDQNGVFTAGKQLAAQLRPASVSAPASVHVSWDRQQHQGAEAASQPAAGMLVSSDYSVEVLLDTVATPKGSAVGGPTADLQQPQGHPAALAAAGASLAQPQPEQTKGAQAHADQEQRRQGEASTTAAAAADSSAAAKPVKAAETEPVGKPLFVPILVYMDEADHALMADEALSHLGLPDGKTGAGTDSSAASGTDRLSDSIAANGAGSIRGDSSRVDTGSSSCIHSAGVGVERNGSGESGRSGDDVLQQQQSGVTVSEALRRVRLLQEYLCAYEAQGLPVVKVSYGAFGDALDKLHEYVLQCIKVAMQSRQVG